MSSLGERYQEHHRERRDDGDFVFVPERVPYFVAAIGTGKRVLDLGCRSGALTRHFLEGNSVVGLDVDPAALEKAAGLGIEPLEADVEQPLPLVDASFDAVVAESSSSTCSSPTRSSPRSGVCSGPAACSWARCRTRSVCRAGSASSPAARPRTTRRT